jgi:hypothetical protein
VHFLAGYCRMLIRLGFHLAQKKVTTGVLILFNLQIKNEAGILNLLEDQTSAFQMNFNAMIEVRLQTNVKLKESDIIQDELSRLDNMSRKFRDQSTELLTTIQLSSEKLRKVLLSLFELEKIYIIFYKIIFNFFYFLFIYFFLFLDIFEIDFQYFKFGL